MAVLAVGLAGAAIGAGGAVATGIAAGLATTAALTAASIGWSVGTIVGGYLFGPKPSGPESTYTEGPRLAELIVRGGSYGADIPQVWNKARLGAGIIWKQPLREEIVTVTTYYEGGSGGKGGKGGGGGGGSATSVNYTYYGTFACAVCEGPRRIRRIWANSKLIYDMASPTGEGAQIVTVYEGTEDQMPDPTMESFEGAGNVPAYRGLCYLVFHDLPLESFGNSLPNIEVEVVAYVEDPPIYLEGDQVSDILYYSWVSGLSDWKAENPYYVDGSSIWCRTEMLLQDNGDGNPLRVAYSMAKFDIATGSLLDTFEYDGDSPFLARGSIANKEYFWVPNSRYVVLVEEKRQDDADWKDFGLANGGCCRLWVQDVLTGDYVGNAIVPALGEGGSGFAKNADIDENGNIVVMSHEKFGGSPPGGRTHIHLFSIDFSFYTWTYFDWPSERYSWYKDWDIDRVCMDYSTGRVYLLFFNAVSANAWYINKYSPGASDYEWDSQNDEGRIPGVSISDNLNGATINKGLLFSYTNSSDSVRYGTFYVGGDGTVTASVKGNVYLPGNTVQSGGRYVVRYGQDNVLTNSGQWKAFDGIYDNKFADIIEDLCLRAGLTPEQFDTSLMTDSVDGYVRPSTMSARSAIAPIQSLQRFDVVESGGVIRFQPVVGGAGETGLTILEEDLGAHIYGTQQPENLALRRIQELEMPREVRVSYADPNQDYDLGIARSVNPVTVSNVVMDINLPVVMSNSRGKLTANTIMDVSAYDRVGATLSVGLKSLALEAGDIIDVEARDATHRIRIGQVQISPAGLLQIEGVAHDTAAYDQQDAPSDDTDGPTQVPTIVQSSVILLDIPVLRLEHASYTGIYALGYKTAGGGDPWPGATLYYSTGIGWLVGTTWSEGKEGSFGVVDAPLASVLYPFDWDDTSELVVTMTRGTLSSTTDLGAQGGDNAMAVGINGRWELINYVNVEDLGGGQYRLTRFLRGKRGSEWAIGTGQAGDQAIVLDAVGVRRSSSPQDTINLSQPWRMVPKYSRIGLEQDIPFTNTAVDSMPFAPVQIEGWRVGGDLRLEWTPRSRCAVNGLMGESEGLCEASEQYHVEVVVQGGTAVLRTLVVNDAVTTTYTLSAYRADSGDSAATEIPTLDVTVYQISAVVGRGYPGRGTV